MNNEIRHRLAAAFVRYGQDTVLEVRRTEALVRDVCAGAALERNVLIAALRAGVPRELQMARGADQAALVERLARRLQGEHALDAGAARWAVGTWAEVVGAMGLVGVEEPPQGTGEAPEAAAQYEDAVRAFAADGVLEDWEGEELAHLRRELGISAATHAALLAKYQPGREAWPVRLELDDALRRGFAVGMQGLVRGRVCNDGTRALRRIVVRHAVGGVPGVHEHTVSLLGPGRREEFMMPVQVAQRGHHHLTVVLSARDMLGKGQYYQATPQDFEVHEASDARTDAVAGERGAGQPGSNGTLNVMQWRDAELRLISPETWAAWEVSHAASVVRVVVEASERARATAKEAAQRPAWVQPWMRTCGHDAVGAWAVAWLSGVAVTFRWCPPGEFLMGASREHSGGAMDEFPGHAVEMTRGFWLGEVPVTQSVWRAVMGGNPSAFGVASDGGDRPVEQVSWSECQFFLSVANRLHPGLQLRLPTEAEWEYACRAGTGGPTWLGTNDETMLDRIAWYQGNSLETRPVKRKQANPWGLYDMLGNVWEWCSDWYGVYLDERGVDPTGPTMGSKRVRRGGAWPSGAWDLRAARRFANDPGYRSNRVGFRLAHSHVAATAGT